MLDENSSLNSHFEACQVRFSFLLTFIQMVYQVSKSITSTS